MEKGDSLNVGNLLYKENKGRRKHVIYKLIHVPSGKFYVGVTCSLVSRMRQHFGYDGFDQYDPDSQMPVRRVKGGYIRKNWTVKVLEVSYKRSEAIILEQKFITREYKIYGNKGKCLNLKGIPRSVDL